MVQWPGARILRRQELDAFLAQALSPKLYEPDQLQELKVPSDQPCLLVLGSLALDFGVTLITLTRQLFGHQTNPNVLCVEAFKAKGIFLSRSGYTIRVCKQVNSQYYVYQILPVYQLMFIHIGK